MKTTTTTLLLLVAVVTGLTQTLPGGANTTSASGQFQVLDLRSGFRVPPGTARFADTNIIALEPTLLAVSAERVRTVLWRELRISGAWRSKVYLVLRPARTANDSAEVRTVNGLEGWACRVELPDHLTRHRFIRALVEVVLLEYANRSGTDRAAEIPPWLADGFTFHLLANHGTELVLETPRFNANGVTFTPITSNQQRISEFERAHKILVGDEPLTFEQLSWPDAAQLNGPDQSRYLASAQVFTVSLLRLQDGPDCYRNFLAALPAHRNWQLALLRGFPSHFTRLLEVDKWWSLESGHFVGRDLTQTWSVEESCTKLAATLRAPINRYADTNALPEKTDLSLQEVLRSWKPTEQIACVRAKSADLAALRVRLAPELAPLADEYRAALDNWLRKRTQINLSSTSGKMISPAPPSSTATIRQLDDLDARLARLKP
jgi:hypothetical protein